MDFIDKTTGVVGPIAAGESNNNMFSKKTKSPEIEDVRVPDSNIIEIDSAKQLDEQVEILNQSLKSDNRKIEYSIHEATNKIIFRVIDTQTKEIVKEIPSTKLIDFSIAILQQFGLIADEEV